MRDTRSLAGSIAACVVNLRVYVSKVRRGAEAGGEETMRYYFDILDGRRVTADRIGMPFPDDAAAIAEARKSLAIWASDLARNADRSHVTVAVRRDGGEIARLTLDLEVIVSPMSSRALAS